MAAIWISLMLGSLVLMTIKNPDGILSALTDSVSSSFELCIKLAGVYCVWLGFIEVMRQIGALEILSTLLKPAIKKLCGQLSPKATDYVVVNMSANLIGVANASTPTAINAIKQMGEGKTTMTRGMAMLFLINASGLEIMPSTVMGMRAAAGSQSAADIFLPCLVITFVTTGLSILFAALFFGRKENSATKQFNPDKKVILQPTKSKTSQNNGCKTAPIAKNNQTKQTVLRQQKSCCAAVGENNRQNYLAKTNKRQGEKTA